jgi:hypothetical protein
LVGLADTDGVTAGEPVAETEMVKGDTEAVCDADEVAVCDAEGQRPHVSAPAALQRPAAQAMQLVPVVDVGWYVPAGHCSQVTMYETVHLKRQLTPHDQQRLPHWQEPQHTGPLPCVQPLQKSVLLVAYVPGPQVV